VTGRSSRAPRGNPAVTHAALLEAPRCAAAQFSRCRRDGAAAAAPLAKAAAHRRSVGSDPRKVLVTDWLGSVYHRNPKKSEVTCQLGV
jgi:hypothetical protein